jgi:hypothetical protein
LFSRPSGRQTQVGKFRSTLLIAWFANTYNQQATIPLDIEELTMKSSLASGCLRRQME